MERVDSPLEVLQSRQVPPLMAQVTEVKVGGQVAYIRENTREGKNVLELLAPESSWAKISAIVLVEDNLKREIHRNEEFTLEWVKEVFGKAHGQ